MVGWVFAHYEGDLLARLSPNSFQSDQILTNQCVGVAGSSSVPAYPAKQQSGKRPEFTIDSACVFSIFIRLDSIGLFRPDLFLRPRRMYPPNS
jgi:hypothetical protein